jgi:hypothetical protein
MARGGAKCPGQAAGSRQRAAYWFALLGEAASCCAASASALPADWCGLRPAQPDREPPPVRARTVPLDKSPMTKKSVMLGLLRLLGDTRAR